MSKNLQVKLVKVMKFLFLIAFLVSAALANDIDLCIQQKLKLSDPVNHQTILRDIESENLKQFRYAARSALQICHPTFDIVAGQIFKRFTKPKVPLTDVEIKCFERYLVNKNSDGILVQNLDRASLNAFQGLEKCDETVNGYIQQQINQKMPEGNEGELNCLNNLIDDYMRGRIKALVLSSGFFSYEIFTEEKNNFVKELKDVSEKLIECIVGL